MLLRNMIHVMPQCHGALSSSHYFMANTSLKEGRVEILSHQAATLGLEEINSPFLAAVTR